MENEILLTATTLATSGLLIVVSVAYNSLTRKYNQEVTERCKLKRKIGHVENAIYNIKDEDKKEMPKLIFSQTVSDIIRAKRMADEYEGIKPEYEELVEKQVVAQALRNDFRKSDYTKKFITDNMPNELIAIELLKLLTNKDKIINANTTRIKDLENGTEIKKLKNRVHVKDQIIYELRKKFWVKAPKKRKKAGQKIKK